MKKGLETYNNYQVAAFRIFFSSVLLFPYALKSLKKITRETYKPILVVAFIGLAIPSLLFTTAQTRINSSLASMLNSTTPFFTLVIGLLFYKSKVKFTNILGITLGFIGAIGLIVKDFSDILSGINWYASLTILATLFYGINTNEIKAKLSKLNGIEITSLALMFAGPVAGIYLIFSDYSVAATDNNKWLNLMFIFILATFSTVIAQIVFNNLIRHTTAVFASSVTYIIPVFAILWGIVDGEKIAAVQLFWVAIILLGVYLVNKK